MTCVRINIGLLSKGIRMYLSSTFSLKYINIICSDNGGIYLKGNDQLRIHHKLFPDRV